MKRPTIAVMLSYDKMMPRLKLHFRDATKAVDMDVTEVTEVRPAPYWYSEYKFRSFCKRDQTLTAAVLRA